MRKTLTASAASGTSGDDLFSGTPGNDSFDGGDGRDTVEFAGNLAGYRISLVNGQIKIVDTDSSDGDTGTDWLSNIETLHFADRDLSVGIDSTTTQLATQVNSTGDGASPSIAALADGGYIVVWDGTSGSSSEIFAQRYDASGARVGNAFQVNATSVNSQLSPSVTALSNGGFVVAWTGDSQNGSASGEIYLQCYDASGATVGGEQKVTTSTWGFQQWYPEVTATADGGFSLSWDTNSYNSSKVGVHVQHYDASGNEVGAQIDVGGGTGANAFNSEVLGLENGNTVLFRVELADLGGGDYAYAIRSQQYDGSGNTVGSEHTITSNVAPWNGDGEYSVTTLEGGDYLVAYLAYDANGTQIHTQRYDLSGAEVGGDTAVYLASTQYVQAPEVAGLKGGGYVLAWQGEEVGGGADVYVQVFDENGTKVGGEVRVNAPASGAHWFPEIATLEDGSFVITWQGSDDDSWDVASQRFDPDNLSYKQVLKITGTGDADSIYGGSGDQKIFGQDGDDILAGGNGRDVLYGGSDDDRLLGGAGRDTFVFDTAITESGEERTSSGFSNIDRLADFNAADDTVHLESSIFWALSEGALAGKNFRANASGTAIDGNDYIVYNTTTGALSYDYDGNGGEAAVQFAVVGTATGHPTLTAADFVIV